MRRLGGGLAAERQGVRQTKEAMRTARTLLWMTSAVALLAACAKNDSPKGILDRGIGSARQALKDRSGGQLPFEGIFWYGAVDSDPGYATVWVLMGGNAESVLPPWTGFRNSGPDLETGNEHSPVPLDPITSRKLNEMRQVIETELHRAGWSGVVPWVGFEAHTRVAREGYRYFK